MAYIRNRIVILNPGPSDVTGLIVNGVLGGGVRS